MRTACATLLALLVPGAAIALASDFDHPASSNTSQQFTPPPAPTNPQRQDKPNDPEYDNAEPDGNTPHTTNFYDERFDLFGFPSQLTPLALYTDGPNASCNVPPCRQVAGFNAAGAWKRTRGRGDVVIAILDTGIKWDREGLRTQIHVNTGELPKPQDSSGNTHPGAGNGGYDLNANGVVDVDDWKDDPRVTEHTGSPSGSITGQDLIKRFSDGTDADHNGFIDDIAGWDFFDDDNDPFDQSSYFAAGNHGSGRASDAAERGNDGKGDLGTCPHCQLMPLRIWDTFVSDGNTFAQGIVYATDNGASVIEGANGSLDHTAFAEHASEYAYQHNVVQTFSGDDLNTANHNYPANYGHAMLIEGTVPDSVGLGEPCPPERPPDDTPKEIKDFINAFVDTMCGVIDDANLPGGTNIPIGTFFRGANTTQFGGKSSISMEGPTGSVNTGKASGAAGLVVSSARDAHIALHADEAREILEQTAEDVTPGNTAGAGNPDPAQTGWDSHFGWGRANLGAAVSVAASKGKIPDEAAIDAPDWYAPLTGKTLKLTGRVDARFTAGHKLHYKVEWGAGQAPTTWKPVAEATTSGPITGLGTIDLDKVRAAVASYNVPPDPAGPTFSPTAPNPFQREFAVRLTVTDPTTGTDRIDGVDRRIFTALADPDLRTKQGYPKKMGTGGEAQPRYADLNGDNVPELIVPTEDGTMHAYEPDGNELPGWPVHTRTQWTATEHINAPGMKAVAKANPPREAPRGPAVADLDGDGEPEVITVAGIHVYVWEPDGSQRKGFPVSSNRAFCGSALEKQENLHPKCGFVASPAIGHLEGKDGSPSIVIPSLDGHVYALRPNGTRVPHFPRLLQTPEKPKDEDRQIAESINGAAIVDLNRDGFDDVIAADNEAYGGGSPNDVSFAGLLGTQGQSTRVYAVNGTTGAYMPGWPIHIAGILQTTLPFIGPGHDPAVVDLGGPKVFASATTGSLSSYNPDGSLNTTMRQEAFGAASNATDRGPALNLFESAAIGRLTPASVNPDVVKYEISTTAAVDLLLVGQNQPYNHLIGAWSSTTGDPKPAFPTITDDFQFVSSSLVAKAARGSATNQVVAGTGLGLLHAYDGATGQDVAHFPKVTGGWLIAPPALSDDGTRVAAITREGYLFEWSIPIAECQTEWPTYRHDNQNTGDYNADGTAPAAPQGVSLKALGSGRYHLTFTSPGDDRMCGTPARYRTLVDGERVDLNLGAPVAGGKTVSKDVRLPDGAGVLAIQAADDGKPNDGAKRTVNPGNLGARTEVAVPGGKPKPPPCKGAAPSSSIKKEAIHVEHTELRLYGHAVGARCVGNKSVRARVRSVRVSVARVSGGKCRYLGQKGGLGRPTACAKRRYLTAHLTPGVGRKLRTRWSVKRFKVQLPSGRYTIATRALGRDGLVERTFRSSNTASYHLR